MTLDIGCGRNKYPGAIGIDNNPETAADVLCDLDRPPYPFRDSSFDQIRGIHVIEHVSDVLATMKELHRLARPGGLIVLVTPHYTDFSSWCDPTHRWHGRGRRTHRRGGNVQRAEFRVDGRSAQRL